VPLLDRKGWKPDEYLRADDVSPAPAVLVPHELLAATLAARPDGQRVGVELANTFQPRDLLPVQGRLDLVAIRFPAFSDGRGFSIGRMLREQGYGGALRAAGAIIPDQFAFALRCGFDEVEINEEQAARQPIEQWLHALNLIGASYQNGEDGIVSIFKKRRLAA
jgi:uncharacterized protein (DUF934 family)